MISCMPLVLIVIGPILLLWLTMSRVPRVRWLTASILTGLALVAGTLIYLLRAAPSRFCLPVWCWPR